MRLEDRFGGKTVGFKTPNVCEPHFSDLSPLDNFLWGYCKDNVYDNKPEAIDQRKSNVTRHIRSIVNDMCSAVLNNFKRRMQSC